MGPQTALPEAEFLDEIQKQFLRGSFFTFSHLYSFTLRYIFFQTRTTSYSFYSSVTVHCKRERRKTWQKIMPPPYGLRNTYRNLKSENSHDYAKKLQRNCAFMNSAQEYRVSSTKQSTKRKTHGPVPATLAESDVSAGREVWRYSIHPFIFSQRDWGGQWYSKMYRLQLLRNIDYSGKSNEAVPYTPPFWFLLFEPKFGHFFKD